MVYNRHRRVRADVGKVGFTVVSGGGRERNRRKTLLFPDVLLIKTSNVPFTMILNVYLIIFCAHDTK